MALPGIIYGLLAAGGGLTPSNPSYTAREVSIAERSEHCERSEHMYLLQDTDGPACFRSVPSRRQLAHQLRSSKSALLICQSDVLPIALEAATEVGLAHSRIILMDDKTPGFISVSQIVQRGYQLTEEQVGGSIVYSQDDIKKVPALLPFSSGTTGNPKGVALTHYNLTSNLIQWTTHDGRAGEKVPEGEVQPCFIPLFHMVRTRDLFGILEFGKNGGEGRKGGRRRSALRERVETRSDRTRRTETPLPSPPINLFPPTLPFSHTPKNALFQAGFMTYMMIGTHPTPSTPTSIPLL